MRVFIQGRKDGYRVLYPIPTPREFFRFGGDIQSINARNQQGLYGKSVYSISFEQSGCIFSKFVIGYDSSRANLGNISFSIFIPDEKSLDGNSIVELLDRMSSLYFEKYAPDFYITNKQEDWSLFVSLADGYESVCRQRDVLDVQHMARGAHDAAFVYYASKDELQSYLDDCYQQAYIPYSQVLFVDSSLKDKAENPLNVLKHGLESDLTGKIDLNNGRYRLIVEDPSLIRVEAVDSYGYRKNLFSNEHFFRKTELIITWSKRFYIPKERRGTIDLLKSVVEINEDDKTATIKPIELDIVEKKIQPQFRLHDNPILLDTFTCKNLLGDIVEINDGILLFSGEQTEQEWTIFASKKPFIDVSKSFVPISSSEVLDIPVSEKKRITFTVKDSVSGELIPYPDAYLTDSNGRRRVNSGSITFIDDSLDEKCKLEVRAKHFKEKEVSFTPRSVKPDFEILLDPEPKIASYNSDDETITSSHRESGKPKSWLIRHLLNLILGSFLLISVIGNFLLYCQNHKFKVEANIKSATEYLDGDKLLNSELSRLLNSAGVKDDWNLKRRINLARRYRGFIDMKTFQLSNWKEEELKRDNLNELTRFYSLCKENEDLIKGMQNRLNELWGNDVSDCPLYQICDTLESYIRRERAPKPTVEQEQNGCASESFDGSTTMASDTLSTGQTKLVDIPGGKESKGLRGLIKKIFGKRQK